MGLMGCRDENGSVGLMERRGEKGRKKGGEKRKERKREDGKTGKREDGRTGGREGGGSTVIITTATIAIAPSVGYSYKAVVS